MADTDRHGYPSRPGARDRETLRRSFRLIIGGKATSPKVAVDTRNLEEDRFLREHYLDRNRVSGIIPDRHNDEH